jgi:hypothetical protein
VPRIWGDGARVICADAVASPRGFPSAASPKRLNPNTDSAIATPGKIASPAWRRKYSRPSTASIWPHDGSPAGPKPRNERLASARIVAGSAIVAATKTSGKTFGSTCRSMIRNDVAPAASADSTNGRARISSTTDRTRRLEGATRRNASANNIARIMFAPSMRLTMPRNVIRITRSGSAIHASTTRCTSVSNQPPMYALASPSAVARNDERNTAPNPIAMDSLAP